tara:strand:+ start:461 stop:958 length:498 start_codon:yes stop_codon:yes gene_type:complete
MNKFKFSNYRLPHMAPITFKKVVKEKLPELGRTSEKLEVKKLEEIPKKPKKNILKPMAPVVEGLVSNAAPKQVVSSSGGNDLDEFLKRVESRKITNPEYADQEGPKQSKSYDFFITNRSPESDKVARQMDSLNKAVMEQAKNRQFDEMRKTRAYQQDLMNKYNID